MGKHRGKRPANRTRDYFIESTHENMLMAGPSGGSLGRDPTTGDRSQPYWAASGKGGEVIDLEAFRSGNLICKNAFGLKSEGQRKDGKGDDDFHIFDGLFY
jgi:hypothetical protein